MNCFIEQVLFYGKKYLFGFLICSFSIFFLLISTGTADAIMYSAGQTLNPACGPTDDNCGITAAEPGTYNDISSLPSLTDATSTYLYSTILRAVSTIITNATTTNLMTDHLTVGSGNGLLFSTAGFVSLFSTSSLGSISFQINSNGADANVSGSPTSLGGTIVLSLPSASSTSRGLLTTSDWTLFNSKQSALGFTPENITNKSTSTSLGTSTVLYPTQSAVKSYVDALTVSGDVSGGLSDVAVNKIKGAALTFSSLASQDFLQYNGSAWVNVTPSSLGIGGLLYATTSDVYKYAPSSIAAWGDSFTSGTGGGGTTYPSVIQVNSGITIYNGGVGGETSTQITVRMLAATDKYAWPVIIWSGRNNYSSLSTVMSDIASMVAVLKSNNYLVMGILNNSTEISGTNSYDQIIALNTALSSLYGSHYIDIRTYLISQYNPGVPQDVIDYNNDTVPSSLRSDTLHLNAAGYTIVANYIYNNYFSTLVPPIAHKIITTDVIDTFKTYLLTNPALTGSVTLESATSTQYGAIYKGGSRFIHDYYNAFDDGKNTFVGINSGNFTMGASSGSTYYGSYNTALGYNTLSSNTTGAYNAALGSYALQNNSTGKENVAVGNGSMQTNTIGSYNSAFGRSALSGNVSGTQNTAIGNYSMQLATGANNSTLGYHTLKYQTSGIGNTAIGNNAGVGRADVSNYNTTIDTYMTFIGFGASRANTISSSTALTNATAIGYNATVGTSSAVILGGTGIYAVNVGIGTTSPVAQLETTGTVRFANFGSGSLTTDANGNLSVSSDERLKTIRDYFTRGLVAILALKPINYNWNPISGLDTGHVYTGFSAQNVREAIPEAVGEDKNGYLTLSDRPILAALVNSVKELFVKVDTVSSGSQDTQNGMTIYDTATHEPYCLHITSGQLITSNGRCGDIPAVIIPPVSPIIESTPPQNVDVSTTTEPISEPISEQSGNATSTPPVESTPPENVEIPPTTEPKIEQTSEPIIEPTNESTNNTTSSGQ